MPRGLSGEKEVTIERLPDWCASIDVVLEPSDAGGRIYCVWGEFAVSRETIRGGVRFTLPGCKPLGARCCEFSQALDHAVCDHLSETLLIGVRPGKSDMAREAVMPFAP